VEISFLGGTGTVTGSKYLFDDGDAANLIDCGLSKVSSSSGCGIGSLCPSTRGASAPSC